MRMIDFFMRLYFSFYRRYGKSGTSAAILFVSGMLTLNILTILFILYSSAFGKVSISSLTIAIIVFVLGFAVDRFLTRIYIDGERYEKLGRFKFAFLFYLLAVAHFLFSIVAFILSISALIERSH